MAMVIPEAWAGNPDMDEDKRAFYEYHASLMEPWDGPAAIAFTDGRVIGATLDRNGLRPGRYIVTKDDLVVLASEAGVLDVPAQDIRKKGRLQPGRMFLVDTVQKRIISDAEIKKELAARQPYAEWLQATAGDAGATAGAIARDRVESGDAAAPAESVWLQRRGPAHPAFAHGSDGRGAGGLDGHRRSAGVPVGPAAAAVQLFQAAVRAGDESAHRSDSRRAGDVADQLHRHGAQHPG